LSTPPQPNPPESEGHLYALTIGLAAAVWLAPWLLLGRREAWDDSSYFLVSIPLMTLAAGYAGYRARTRAWRWPLALILGQFATLLLLQGFGNLLPLGIIVLVILGVPMMVGASIGARLGRRNEGRA
jgi:peptidoglycan/LPS O-acetylase OafA/YrhL